MISCSPQRQHSETLRTGSCPDGDDMSSSLHHSVITCQQRPRSCWIKHVRWCRWQLCLLAGEQKSCLKNYSALCFVCSSEFYWKSAPGVCELTNQSRGRGLKRQDRAGWLNWCVLIIKACEDLWTSHMSDVVWLPPAESRCLFFIVSSSSRPESLSINDIRTDQTEEKLHFNNLRD